MRIRRLTAGASAIALTVSVIFSTACITYADETEETEAAEATEADEKPIKVALLLTGSLGDLSFLDSANAGMEAVQKKYGNVECKVIEMGSDSTKYESNFLDASDSDYDIIIGSGWQTQEPIQNVAPEYPNKKYIIFDASVDYSGGDYSNVYSINYKQNEGSFLAGVLATRMSETGKVGFIGGAEGGSISDFLVGYIEGVQYGNPDDKVLVSYVGDFVDSPKCKSLALSQYDQGADILFTAAGSAGIGSLEATKESGKWAIGVDSDQAGLFAKTDPDTAEKIPTSVMKRVDNSLVQTFDKIVGGEDIWGKAVELGLSEDAVGLCDNDYYEKLVPEKTRTELSDITDKIISGDIKVDSAFDMTTEEVNNLVSSVAP